MDLRHVAQATISPVAKASLGSTTVRLVARVYENAAGVTATGSFESCSWVEAASACCSLLSNWCAACGARAAGTSILGVECETLCSQAPATGAPGVPCDDVGSAAGVAGVVCLTCSSYFAFCAAIRRSRAVSVRIARVVCETSTHPSPRKPDLARVQPQRCLRWA